MRVGPLKRLILAVGLALAVARPSAEQATPAPKTLDVADYLHYETPADPRISPDATQIVYTRRWVNRMEDKMESALWVMNADGTKNRFLAKGSNAVWSPDGTRIAYVAEGEPKGAQIFVRWMDGEGAPSQVTQVEHAPADIDWSPDGKQLGFTMLVPKTSTWDIPMPKPPEGAHWTKAPAVIDRLHYRQDRKGYTEPGFTHLFVVPSDGGTPRALTSGDWNVGARFDGMSADTKASYQSAELYVVGFDATGVRKISGTLDRDAGNLQWAADGSGVYFTADDRGTSNVHFAPLSGAVRSVTTGTHMLSLSGPPAKDTAVGVRSAPHLPPDVVRFNLSQPGTPTQITRLNEDLLAGVTLGEVEEIRYDSTGGAKVQGWIVKPPTFEKTKQYPLVLEIHGGPHGMYNVAFNFMFQSFAAKGYVVLYTNPRGSTGYGSAFGNAIERAYPSVDYDDLMAGVDATLAKGFVDSRNMFVGGCSGGGVLSSWVIGHTDRFAAAAVRCPVTNWLSFQGHTDIPFFTANFFDAPFWEKPEQWLKQSPLMYVGNVKTPTLLMTGVLDMRTPMPQTEEYYTALKMRGVPTKLLRFEGEYHGTSSKPSNFMRTILYMDEWYKEHRRSGPAPTQALR
ncbi:MAG: S9 family peptidase [Acidobacteria bacterium]|nr:S9 family peptidase [Acidobacteriota bacterium]